MSYQYSYLIASLFYLVIWTLLFYLRKDLRREMLVISALFAFAGPFAEIVYFKDWWKPFTLTDSFLSIEPFVIGFAIGGVASIICEEIFKKKHKKERRFIAKVRRADFNTFILLSSLAVIFFGSFFLLRLNSLMTTILAFGIPTLIIYSKRKDLIFNSLLSGILLVIVAMIVYSLVELITPGWVEAFWKFNNTPQLIIINLPLDDVVWYFFAGAFIGPLYEYWKEIKLSKGN